MSKARGGRFGGRARGREGQGGGRHARGRNLNFKKSSNVFWNLNPKLAKYIFIYGSAKCPARFTESWGKIGNARRQTGNPGAAEIAEATETFMDATITTPPAPPAKIEDPDNMGHGPAVMIPNPNLVGENALWQAQIALIPELRQK